MRSVGIWLAAIALMWLELPSANSAEWRAGTAKVKITPKQPMWMSGYGGRDHVAEGTLIDLWAKALVLEDGRGERAAVITLDLVGIDREISQTVCSGLKDKYGLDRRQIALFCSHTHTGPVVGRNLRAMYFYGDDQQILVDRYTDELQKQLVDLVGEAIKGLQTVRLAWGRGQSTIAVNRRNNVEADVPQLRARGELKGPVDFDVPVLTARNSDGKITAILFGYACHATVLPFYQWSGDYPGFAQIELEETHPDAVALFFAGCGGDQNPLPRRKNEIAEEYGRSLARSVNAAIAGVMNPVDGELSTQYSEIPLAFDKLPSREDLAKDMESTDKFVAQRAKMLAAQIDRGQPLSQSYSYPIQMWRLGRELQFVTLGGEVVVDYSLRLKKELGRETTWVAAYANDVMAYIPSLRVLKEGRYEGAGAMVYYGLPTVWSSDVEESIVKAVHRMTAGK